MINTKTAIDNIEKLQIENSQLKQQNKQLIETVKLLEDAIRLARHKKFGASSEKTPIDEQINWFNEAEIESGNADKEPSFEEITYKRRKKKGHRDEMFKDIPVERIEYTLPESELTCNCGGELHEIRKEVQREIKIIPAKVVAVENVIAVYGCRNCEKTGTSTTIKTAPTPRRALPGSPASASVIAYVMNEKFVKSVPLYRQEKEWERMDINISRQSMANWMILASEKWLKYLYDRMREYLIKRDILHADETPLQVLNEPGKSAESKSYMWLYRTGREGPAIVLYQYQTTRAGKHPKKFLEGFSGYLQTDGYDGYSGIHNIVLMGCWAHARRYFTDALKSMPKDNVSGTALAEQGFEFCNRLYSIEKNLRDATTEERYEGRLKFSKPVLDEFQIWLNTNASKTLPGFGVGKAIKYCRNQWENLTAFLLDGQLEIDNNRSERSIKPFVIGRKNWLFCNSQKGANSSATIYSVIETAKENNLKPFEYLTYLFEKMPNIDIEDKNALDELLPWSENLPDCCRKQNPPI